ncbi:Apolipoprotein D [Orchesella cincta]|uniref:Apolipoprotein D n=1 Tax=Orchesella cincta TaxID=48709 RepID=A0A1D2M261_ORCCI|nr:Apolipoprotein D [Orchesella cincta]
MFSIVLNFLAVSVGLIALSSSTSLPLKLGQAKSPYGTCKTFLDYTPVHFFDVDRFTGYRIWYVKEIHYLDNEENAPSQKLSCYSITMRHPNDRPKIVQLFWRFYTGGLRYENVSNYTTENGMLPLESIWAEVVMQEPIVPLEPYTPMIWVQTDYDNWAIAYDCRNYDSSKSEESYSTESMILFTRDPNYSDEKTLDILRIVMENYGFSAQNMTVVDQSNCDPPI